MICGSILVAQSRGVIIMSDNSKRVFGYCRVSSKGQNLDRQLKALLDFGVLKRDIFCDETSGKNFDRPKYKELKSLLQAGDLLVVLDLDRLGRNYAEMEREWRIITKEIIYLWKRQLSRRLGLLTTIIIRCTLMPIVR